MDKKDVEILRELLEDCQAPFSRIAKKLNLSTGTVIKRCKKMNLIACQLAFDPAKLGYHAIIFLLIKIAPNYDRMETIGQLKNVPGVFAVIEIIGEFNLFVNILVKSLKEFTSAISKINELPTVERLEFMLSEDFTLLRPNANIYSTTVEQMRESLKR